MERVDLIAFDQEDLGNLLDEDKPLIYLCNNRFTIPLRKTHKTYVGIGKAVAVIYTNKVVDLDKLNIKFENIRFDDNYEEILKRAAQQKLEAEAAAFPKKCMTKAKRLRTTAILKLR